jgi:hypothetical protein
MIFARQPNPTIDAFIAQLPSTVSVKQQGEICCVQPQTMEALQTILTLLSQPAFASIQIVQNAGDAQTLEATQLLYLDTTVATLGIFNHKPPDFVVTVGTGKTLVALESELRNSNQTLAFTPADGNTTLTIGQLLANNTLPLEANIRRSTFNELVLGCSAFAPTTAEAVAFGGEVVKNVTGYDVQKFLVGHHHAFGVVSSVTLRTTPLLPVKGCFTGVFQTEADLFTCLQNCLSQPSLWMTHLLVKPHSTGFLLSVGVEAPSLLLLDAWQAFYFPNSQFEAELSPFSASQLKPIPLLAFEMALPLGQASWKIMVHQLIPLLNPDEWQLLPACGVLQVFYHQTPPTLSLIEQIAKSVSTLAGSFRLIHADSRLKALSAESYRLQWKVLPKALQRHHHQLKQQLDPDNQFYSPFYQIQPENT